MSDLIELQRGRDPWNPSDDAELVEVLNRYDIPLLGIVRQRNALHVFESIGGPYASLSFWIYRHVTEDEADRLRSLDSAGLREPHALHYGSRQIMLAIAVADEGIVVFQPVDEVGMVGRASRALIERYDEYVRHIKEARDSARPEDLTELSLA